MADYRDRLRPSIQLTSPDGTVFTALWVGNESSHVKKIGIFDYPGVAGSTVQDQNIRSAMYPLTLQFEGPDNDLTAKEFVDALTESGVWEVVHPVLGLLKLQPMTFTPEWQPVTSGNITVIKTEWIEPLDIAVVPSVPELQAAVAAQIETVNEVAAEQLEQSTFQKIAAEAAAIRDATLDVVAAVEEKLEAVSDFAADITAEMLAIKRDIDAVLAVVPMDIIALAGQIKELIQLPARAIQDVQARLDAYKGFAQSAGLLSPDTPGTPSFNRVAVQEAALTAAMGAVADVASTGDLLSRTEAVGVIEDVLALFDDITNNLDVSQTLFENSAIDAQYFSQSQSYSVAARLNALVVAYLLRAAFDLKVEKRFVLTQSRNPVMVTIEEYGSLGEDDLFLDLFNASNKIQGDEFIMMPKGRELVVYV